MSASAAASNRRITRKENLMRVQGQTSDAPAPVAAYSQAIRMGDLVSVAGQAGIDPATGSLAGDTLDVQLEQTRKNIEASLRSCSATMNDVIRVDVYLANLADFAELNRCYAQWFTPPYPTRTTVGVQLASGLLAEVTVLAVAPHGQQ
jgi:reactive intermediate/imine deaminase